MNICQIIQIFFLHQITDCLCWFLGEEQQEQKPAWLQRCHAVQKLFVWYSNFFLKYCCWRYWKHNIFQHTLHKILFQAYLAEPCKTLSEISLQSAREGIERSKLSWTMFDSFYMCWCQPTCCTSDKQKRKKSRAILESWLWWQQATE